MLSHLVSRAHARVDFDWVAVHDFLPFGTMHCTMYAFDTSSCAIKDVSVRTHIYTRRNINAFENHTHTHTHIERERESFSTCLGGGIFDTRVHA